MVFSRSEEEHVPCLHGFCTKQPQNLLVVFIVIAEYAAILVPTVESTAPAELEGRRPW